MNIAVTFNWTKIISRIVIRALASMFLFVVPLMFLEITLRHTTWLDQLNAPNPSYMPPDLKLKYANYDKSGFISLDGFRTAEPSGSLLAQFKNDPGCKIIVLGDSFVWGQGLDVGERWIAKLQNKIDCNIYPFGKRGWSTYEYLSYYDEHLQSLQADFIIIGLVSNDPHPRGQYDKFKFDKNFMVRSNTNDIANLTSLNFLKTYRDRFQTLDYINQVLKNFIDSQTLGFGSFNNPPIVEYGYQNWEKRLYEEDLFEPWIQALKSFQQTNDRESLFLFTPTSNSPHDVYIWEKIKDRFETENLQFHDTMDALNRGFGQKTRPRDKWANPADAHPGILQSEIFSEEAHLALCTKSLQPNPLTNDKLNC